MRQLVNFKPLWWRELRCIGDGASLLRTCGLSNFDDFMDLAGGEHVCHKRGRSVYRFNKGGRTFYLKRNRLHLAEFLKGLLRLRLPPRSALKEWENIQAVSAAGIPTVTPVIMGEELVCGLEKASFTLTEALYDAEPLEEVFRREFGGGLSPLLRRQKRTLVRRVAEIVRRLHDRGMYHQDLYLGHFYLGSDATLYLIDLQRVGRRGKIPQRYLIKDLAQLAYSGQVTSGVSRTDQMRFFHAYAQVERLGQAEKAVLRRVLGRCRRIARHTVKLLHRRRRRGEVS